MIIHGNRPGIEMSHTFISLIISPAAHRFHLRSAFHPLFGSLFHAQQSIFFIRTFNYGGLQLVCR